MSETENETPEIEETDAVEAPAAEKPKRGTKKTKDGDA